MVDSASPSFLLFVILWCMLSTADTYIALPSKILSKSTSETFFRFKCLPTVFRQAPFLAENDFRAKQHRKSPIATYLQDASSREPGFIHLQNDDMPSDANKIYSTDNYLEIEECAKFFVDAFWLQGTTFGKLQLKSEQRKELECEQNRDMSERYGRLVGKRKLQSSLLIARDDSGAIEGCVGIEIAVADSSSGTVLSRCARLYLVKFAPFQETVTLFAQDGRRSAPAEPFGCSWRS